MKVKQNETALSTRTSELARIFKALGKEIDLALETTQDPELREILMTMSKLGNRIATFFLRIKGILTIDSRDNKIQFVSNYFFKNFSIVSENTRASRAIIKYVLNRLEWLKAHSDRIIESLKTLYADLLSMQIDCEESYKFLFNESLGYDFGLNPHNEIEEVNEVLTLDKAYSILGITKHVTRDQVKVAFRKLAKKLHPDLNPDANKEHFIQVQNAYKRLLVAIKR